MAKRRANKDLNHENWDQEDSDEGDEGTGAFESAPKEQIATRKIAVAKRRNPAGSTSTTGGASLFAGFAGFGAPAASATKSGDAQPKSLFNFGTAAKTADTPKAPLFGFAASGSTTESKAAVETPKAPLFGGLGGQTFSTSTPLSTTGFGVIPTENGNGRKKAEQSSATAFASNKKQKSAADGDEQFRADLKALNESVITWCQEHIAENPYVDLTPVFKDYFGHMEELDKQYLGGGASGQSQRATEEKRPSQESKEPMKFSFGTTGAASSSSSDQSKPTTTTTTTTTSSTPFASFKFGAASDSTTSGRASLFGASAEKKPASSVLPAPSFNFNKPPNGSETTNFSDKPPSFNFTQKSAFGSGGGESKAAEPFTFRFGQQTEKNADDAQKSVAPAAPFSFKATGAADAGASGGATDNTGEDDDEAKPYEPPKADFVENDEPDAIFSIKCKMFFMKDGSYVEKGVGTFYLKPIEGGSKTQVLIRAATTTGTVLLNVSLSSKMPTQRVGKNNVSLVCIPHPALDPKHPSGEPATLLIRVKTSDDADKLLAVLEERKKLAD